jgi:hypothetical protein
MHRMIVRCALHVVTSGTRNLAYNIDLTRYLVFVLCKSYLTNNGAKDGILVHSDWYHASKVHSLHLSIIW